MDQIRIEQLEVFAKHGAIPEENVLGQKFLVSAVLFTDTRKAGRNDQLDQTISYGRASKFMERYLRAVSYTHLGMSMIRFWNIRRERQEA